MCQLKKQLAQTGEELLYDAIGLQRSNIYKAIHTFRTE